MWSTTPAPPPRGTKALPLADIDTGVILMKIAMTVKRFDTVFPKNQGSSLKYAANNAETLVCISVQGL